MRNDRNCRIVSRRNASFNVWSKAQAHLQKTVACGCR